MWPQVVAGQADSETAFGVSLAHVQDRPQIYGTHTHPEEKNTYPAVQGRALRYLISRWYVASALGAGVETRFAQRAWGELWILVR